MIPVDFEESVVEPAGEFEEIETTGNDAVVWRKLTDSEESKLFYIDAEVEKQYRTKFQHGCPRGRMFAVAMAKSFVSDELVGAVKRLWESGGWLVDVFPVEGGYQVVFARPFPGSAVLSKAVVASLKARDERVIKPQTLYRGELAMAPLKTPRMNNPLLIRFPTRSRPEQALRVLALYRELAVDHPVIEVIMDDDDLTMHNAVVLQALYDLDCVITIGQHRSKIEACNAGRVDDWAVLVLASDDMVPVARGYDRKIVEAMRTHYPLMDGSLCINDGHNVTNPRPGHPILCTLPIIGRHLYEQFGFVYDPRYRSLCSDNQQTELFTSMKRMAFVKELLIEHRHHAAAKAPMDALYTHNDSFAGVDHETFVKLSETRRPGSQFAFDSPEMLLSILICSTTARAKQLSKLVEYLRWQMIAFPREVELCVDVDDGQVTIGEKRNRLLERACATNVAFVDDDDWVDSRYVSRIMQALKSDREADCCSLVGTMTTNNSKPERFEHSLKYDHWYTRSDGVYIRTPNHLSCVRRELAIKAGFPSKNFGEDHSFSNALYPLLKKEVSTGDETLYYYWVRAKEKQGA